MNRMIKKPNILIILVDEQRFPPPYEDDSIREWRAKNLKAQEFLLKNGVEFKNHHAASTACAASRTTLYTGQYPSLHGVTQTDGAAKSAFDPGMFWLDPNTVPTLGDYLRVSGYDTFWKGKWHASHADIIVPDTHDSYLSFDTQTGIPIAKNQHIYLNANRLDKYGFRGWVGPEPHGTNPHNSGASATVGLSGRDEIYAFEVIKLLSQLQHEATTEQHEQKPWAIVASFVNPHDIALFGEFTRILPTFNFEIDSSVPTVPPAPTASESLDTKPVAQESYRITYPKAFQPLVDSETYRRLYYSLQLTVDREVDRVLEALKESVFYKDTIIVYASDHGELLGAHGGLFQKWYQAYEEAIHVPLIIHNPKLIPHSKSVDMLTSHVDVLPTILGLLGIDAACTLEELKKNYTEAHPLVGRDLTPLIKGEDEFHGANEPIYFMTDDDVTRGLNQITVLGMPYKSVIEPNHIETVIAELPTGDNNKKETWKYSRYFDNPQFWSSPGQQDTSQALNEAHHSSCDTSKENTSVPDEFELYNLTEDPIEARNLANLEFATAHSSNIQAVMAKLLAQQCKRKRLYPTSGNVPGKPSCKNCTLDFGI